MLGGGKQPSRQRILAKKARTKLDVAFEVILISQTHRLPFSLLTLAIALSFPTDQMSRHPEVLWAQRSEKVYLTVALPDAKDVSVKCEPQGLFSFSASGVQGESYSFTLELYGPIVPEGCKTKAGLRNILCSVQKAQKGWWKRLLKSEEKPAPYLKVDWHRWCDEDDEESASDLASDDDARFVGQDDGSSDDEGMLYLPDLEKARV